MKHIDFTPASYRERTAQRVSRGRAGRSLTLLIAAMATFSAWKLARVQTVRAQIESIRQAGSAQEPIVNLATAVRLELAGARGRERMRDLAQGGAPMHGVLAELSRCMPQDVWASKLQIEQPTGAILLPAAPSTSRRGSSSEEGRNVVITGYARDESAIGALMTRLTASPVFLDVRMVYSRAVEAGELQGREFELSCRLPVFE
jgi:hypothetical protein